MKIIIAIDSFKECLTSNEANNAAMAGVLEAMPEADVQKIPVSDGGEGWLEAVHHAVGGKTHMTDAVDPLLRPIRVPYLFDCKTRTAYIESAKVIGMGLLVKRLRCFPQYKWSAGMAEVLVRIWKSHPGCHIVVGLGGSATCDVGTGMMEVLYDYDQELHFKEKPLPTFTIASDVSNPLCGPTGAARMFAPQKGATPEEVELLERRAAITAQKWKRMLNGRDCSTLPGAGAAGGLGYAFMQWFNADYQPGIDMLLKLAGFNKLIADADLIITGEGSADRQTLLGKLPLGILNAVGTQFEDKKKKPAVCLIAGRVQDKEMLVEAGFNYVECINPPSLPLEEALKKEIAKDNIKNTIRELILHKIHKNNG